MPKRGKASLQDRLHRIEGQIRGVERMLEGEEDLQKVITQIQAVVSGLDRVKLEVVKRYVRKNIEKEVLEGLDFLK
jgi:DNA-binding FrmR family transcriptional regulator